MSESISIGLKRAAIALAEQLDYARAAEQLSITSAELRKQVCALETLLCLRIFKPRQKKAEPTEEGRFLIKAFREAMEAASSKTAPGANSQRRQNEVHKGRPRATDSATSVRHKTRRRMSLIKMGEQCGIWRSASLTPPAKVIAPVAGETYRVPLAKVVAYLAEDTLQLFHLTRLKIGVCYPLVHGAMGADREGVATER